MSDADKRQIKIKVGALKRLRRELALYMEEQEKEQAKVQKLRDDGADPHDIKYAVSGRFVISCKNLWAALPFTAAAAQENILNESAAMVPDTRRRLEAALRELQALVVSIPFRLPVLPASCQAGSAGCELTEDGMHCRRSSQTH